MKRTKLMLSILLSIVMMVTMSPTLYAADISEFLDAYTEIREEKFRRIEEIVNSPNSDEWIGVVRENLPLDTSASTYPNCTDCGVLTYSVCAGESTLLESGYHSVLFQDDCFAYYFGSNGAEMCRVCYKVLWQYGVHYCYEIHNGCSKGRYDRCPMQIK